MKHLILLLVLLTGCRDETTDAQKIAIGCSSAAAAIRVLTVADTANALSEDAHRAVVEAIRITEPICRRETPPSLTDVEIVAFAAAVGALQTAAASAPGVRL